MNSVVERLIESFAFLTSRIQREIEAVNANFARVETIKKFFLIERQLTPEDEELTPTMKLKRNFVNKRYAIEIEAMYGRAAA